MGQLKEKQTEIHLFYTTAILFRLLQQSMKGHVIYTCVPGVDAQLLVEGIGWGRGQAQPSFGPYQNNT